MASIRLNTRSGASFNVTISKTQRAILDARFGVVGSETITKRKTVEIFITSGNSTSMSLLLEGKPVGTVRAESAKDLGSLISELANYGTVETNADFTIENASADRLITAKVRLPKKDALEKQVAEVRESHKTSPSKTQSPSVLAKPNSLKATSAKPSSPQTTPARTAAKQLDSTELIKQAPATQASTKKQVADTKPALPETKQASGPKIVAEQATKESEPQQPEPHRTVVPAPEPVNSIPLFAFLTGIVAVIASMAAMLAIPLALVAMGIGIYGFLKVPEGRYHSLIGAILGLIGMVIALVLSFTLTIN